MKRLFLSFSLLIVLLASCATVDLNAAIPAFDTGVDPNALGEIPAGEFHFGQHEDIETRDAYEIMITDVTTAQYADFLSAALADGYVKVAGEQIVGFYPATNSMASNTRRR